MASKQQVTPADTGDHPGTGSDVAGGTGGAAAAHRPVVSTGNPRLAIAFPFSKIEVREPSGAVADVAAMVWRLAEQVAALADHVATLDSGARSSAADTSVADLAAESGRMAAEAGALAHRIMTGS